MNTEGVENVGEIDGAAAAAAADPGGAKNGRRKPAPANQIPESQKMHIDKVARYVAEEDRASGAQSEAIFKNLLSITRDEDRWGFMSPGHPYHRYYTSRKASVRRRIRRHQCQESSSTTVESHATNNY